ncbi:MAG: tetratricopeptide repeat protein [Syntrophothermus sp.]
MGRFEQAGKKLEQMLADSPNDGHLLYLMAICLYGSDRNEEALASCTEALNNGFSVERCNLLLGRIYVGLKKYVEAEECFLTALRVNPRNAEAIATYGFLMLKTGHDRKAAQLMDEALRLDPDNETVLHYNFYRHLAADKRDEQLQILKRYLQTSDSEVRKLVKIGLSDWFRNDYKSARENFRQAYLLDPTNVDILSILQEVTRQSHILFLPHRLVAKIGGPVVLWMIFITLTVILVRLNLDSVTIAVMLIYLLYVIYSWMAPIVYKILVK